MHKRLNKLLCFAAVLTLLICCFAVPAAATGDVAGAVQSTWTKAQGQIKSIANDVVFPVIDVILAILFFAKISTSYFDYRNLCQYHNNKCDSKQDVSKIPELRPTAAQAIGSNEAAVQL